MSESRKRGRVFWTVAVLAALASVVPLYHLSLGPLLWLYSNGYVSGGTYNAYAYPSQRLRRFVGSEWLDNLAERYFDFWRPPPTP